MVRGAGDFQGGRPARLARGERGAGTTQSLWERVGTRVRSHGPEWPVSGRQSPVLLDDTLLRALERLALASAGLRADRIAGARRSARRAPAAEFVEHRAYSPGDDPRRVDWHAYARLGTPVVRLGEQPAGTTVRVIVDCSRSMDWGDPNKLLRARQIAAGLGYLALCHLDRIVIETIGLTPRPHSRVLGGSEGDNRLDQPGPDTSYPSRLPPPTILTGKVQAHRLFRALGELRANPAGQAPDAVLVEQDLADRAAHYRPNDWICLISDLLVPGGYREALRAWQARGLGVHLVQVLAPQELRPDLTGDCELVDAETGERREMALADETLDRYRRRLADWLKETEAFCAARRIPYARVDTSAPLESILLNDLRRSGVLA